MNDSELVHVSSIRPPSDPRDPAYTAHWDESPTRDECARDEAQR